MKVTSGNGGVELQKDDVEISCRGHLRSEVNRRMRHHSSAMVMLPISCRYGPLFTGRTGGVLRPGSFWHIWDKARKSTGITGYHFHDLRHYAATTFSATGASTKELMNRGGWRTTPTAVRYQHATSERDAELARSLPPLLPVGRPRLDSLETKPFEIGSE
jgi:integrase